MDDNKTLSIALGHLLDFTPIGWCIVVALVVMAVFAWILGSRVFTRWLLHKALVLFIIAMVVRSLARMFLNE
ncbi:MAG: hypothetical protein WCB11_28840 [Terriglobales bacterium]